MPHLTLEEDAGQNPWFYLFVFYILTFYHYSNMTVLLVFVRLCILDSLKMVPWRRNV